ncbi:polysaccharide deacetylase family protein [Clostridium sp. AWRP]|uniref:polysaccharide deacetylase family protein n=1 Tax=Clostridium sp. AWRP TaxID=2212991 RepID=UPI000FDCBBB0|nr:polysaccharide deacetylase family protein [Clostridium sp. AWRP]AZV57708.1 polysaccharide deacetylase [Clostridium sp. AWRP]
MKVKYFLLTIFYILCISLNSAVSASSPNTSEQISCNKTIYLTFDDGPSTEVTPKILDTLKEENVKATFFIIGCKIQGREDIVKRIFNEGNSIGLHTYTHKSSKIYSSSDSFLDEMNKTSIEIEKVVGFAPKIIRFPTGSNGHLTNSLLEKLHSSGYKIYDWNLPLSDGIDYNTSVDQLYKEGTGKCVNPNKIFLLAHCDSQNKNTCVVLSKIIKHYKELGYEFKTITENTPEYHFRVRR